MRKTPKKKRKATNYKKKADAAWSLMIRLRYQHCQICGKSGYITKAGITVGGLNAHHIIGRSNSLFRHDLNNGHCLCVGCHKFSRTCGPHSGSIIGITGYVDWFKENLPEQWEWFLEHKFEKGKPDMTFEETYIYLTDKLNRKDYKPK